MLSEFQSKEVFMITGKQSKEARGVLGLSQADVSKGANIGRSYISQFEGGVRNLEKNNLLALFNYYEEGGYKFMKNSAVLDESESVHNKLNDMTKEGKDTVKVPIVELSDLIHFIADAHIIKPEVEGKGNNVIDKVLVSESLLDSENMDEIVEDYLLAEKSIKDHFILDDKGGTTAGFFGREDNAVKLINSMALQYVRMIAIRDGILMVPFDGFENYEVSTVSNGKDANAVVNVVVDRLNSLKPDLGEMFKFKK